MKRYMCISILLATILLLMISSGYSFELNGFGSVSFTKSSKDANTTRDEFRNGDFTVGAVDLYLAESLDDIEVLSELAVENGAIDLERFSIGYTFNDALKVRAGRFHTPLGFWNILYHHGVQLQPTIDRPEFLKFEDDGGILPTHVVGAYLSGKFKTAVGGLEYGAIVGNGPRIKSGDGTTNILDPNNTADNNIGKAVAFNLAISPEMVEGLKVEVSGHMANVDSDSSVTKPVVVVSVDQTILNASLMYTIADVDFMGEYFSIKDKDVTTASTGSFTNNAYYGLLRYTFKDKWVPYLLWEHIEAKDKDPYLISLGKTVDNTESMAGIRYNINYRSSIKVEARNVKLGSDNWNEYAAQWALAF